MSNPYKSMFVTSTSTWGDNEFKRKWPITSPEGKLEVVKAVLTHNTLPQAREMVQFIFRVRGVPRWLFDYHTQTPFTSFMSIGCRDNNKSDVDIVTLDELPEKHKNVMKRLKSLYSAALKTDQASWQSARSFLPQSYQHSYHFGQNLLSLVSMRGFNASGKFDNVDNKEWAMSELYKKVVDVVAEKFPLIGEYLNVIHNDTEEVLEYIKNIKYENLSESDKKLFTDE
tara:strand:- start:4197 stop:4877 length:681 start_codon:yes stop_codon:yes gene_type:complete